MDNNEVVEEVVVEESKVTTPIATTTIQSSVSLNQGARLIQVTGKNEPYQFINVPLLSEFLNLEDVFIMASDAYIFVWCGSEKVNMGKKAKAVQMAQKLKAEIGCQRAISVLETGDEHPTFLYCLGVPKGTKLQVEKQENDIFQTDPDDETTILEPEYFIYKLSVGDDGKPSIKPIEQEEPEDEDAPPQYNSGIKQELLESNSCFILDCEHEIYIWQGSKVKKSTKEALVPLSKKIWAQYDRPDYYDRLKIQPIMTMVYEGAESILFKSKFVEWVEKQQPLMTSYLSLQNKNKKELLSFDHQEMYHDKEIVPLNIGVSNYSSGKLFVWSSSPNGSRGINKWSKVEEDDFGIFFSNKSYICHYIYKPEGKNSIRSVIFYWEGLYSNARNYVGYKFGLYKEIQKKMQALQSDDPIEFRISQNKEPLEFINLFGTELLVLNEELSMSKPMIFQVRGIRGTQLYSDPNNCNANLLNSLDSFVFIFPEKQILVWHGSASNEQQRTLAADLFTFLPPEYESDVTEFDQGSEDDSFWQEIGGSKHNVIDNTDPTTDDGKAPETIKFFLCTEATGIFRADQINPFSQIDLNSEECVLLDVHFKVFLWKGSKSTDQKYKDTLALANQYINDQPLPRENCTIENVDQYSESSLFKSYFHSWKVTPPKVFIDPRNDYKQALAIRLQKEKEDFEKLQKEKADAEAIAATESVKGEEVKVEEVKVEEVKVEEVKVEEVKVDEVKVDEVKVEEDKVEEETKVEETKVDEETKFEEETKVNVEEVKVEEETKAEVEEEEEVKKETEIVDEATTTTIAADNGEKHVKESNEVTPTTTTTASTITISVKDKRKSNEPIAPSVINSSGEMFFAYEPFHPSQNTAHSPKQGRKGGKKHRNKQRNHSVDSNSPLSNGSSFSKSLKNDITNQMFELSLNNNINGNDGTTVDGADTIESKSPLSSSTSSIPQPSNNNNNNNGTPRKNNKKNKKKHNRSSSLTHA